MLARRAGRIINLTSSAGTRPLANGSGYSCSKAALTMFTAVLGLELGGTGVVTFALSPLAVTDMVRTGAATPGLSDEMRAFFAMLLADPDRYLTDTLRLFRAMLSGGLDHVSGSYLQSSQRLEPQLARLSER
jgi:NAD(P)-dependent dehydrogenase (short-subunit alcohol dehydrogenase family)